jgi:phage shock protein C
MPVSCKNCGTNLNDDARFCSTCGAQVGAQQPAQTYSSSYGTGYGAGARLIRPRYGRMLAGVCQGLANSYGWDVTWVRVITVLLAVFGGGIGIVAYVVFWIVMPEEPLALPQPTPWPPAQS